MRSDIALHRMRTKRNLLHVALLICLMTSGCASISSQIPAEPAAFTQNTADHVTKGWWAARFKIHWPVSAEPSWYLDPLLADRVIRPALNELQGEIELWRFHRRARRDEAGHQFSFIFFASPAAAQQIYRHIQANATLKMMQSSGLIDRVGYESTDRITKPDVEDTSDPNWSPMLQKAWPFFIMGVSQTWLELIRLEVQQTGAGKRSTVADLTGLYRRVNDAVADLWQQEGGHAFLHHLNAIFGYEPVQVYERRQMSF